MSKPRLTDTQIVALLKEAESGVPVPELRRRHNVGQSTYCKWRSNNGGMLASDVRRLVDRI